jgi:hypothetical protein
VVLRMNSLAALRLAARLGSAWLRGVRSCVLPPPLPPPLLLGCPPAPSSPKMPAAGSCVWWVAAVVSSGVP